MNGRFGWWRGAILAMLMAVTAWLAGSVAAQETALAPDESASVVEQNDSDAPQPQAPRWQPVPPELLRALEQQKLVEPRAGDWGQVGPAGRAVLALVALSTVLAGTLVCRALSRAGGVLAHGPGAYILFGVFGGLAGLLVAAAATGSLYLHVAAACCTVLSGFSIFGWLMPQFETARGWITGSAVDTGGMENGNDAHAPDADAPGAG